MRIGIIREGKIPSDNRVTLAPEQCRLINDETNHEVIIQASKWRCFKDDEYREQGLQVVEHIEDCDMLMGVKEVPLSELVPNQTYMFFSHTIKKQSKNRALLQKILALNIRLIDYETLKDENGHRVIAFGKFAGMVGAHNAIMVYGSRTGLFALERMNSFLNYKVAKERYRKLDWPPMKIVLTGTGRVGNGAAQVLRDMGINELSASDFLKADFKKAYFTQLSSSDYISHKTTGKFDKADFYKNPENYVANFRPFYNNADIFINGIYWDNKAPKFFTLEEMKSSDFSVQVIADVTCDIAPDASVPSTIHATTIEEPVFGFNPLTGKEEDPYQPDCIDVMSIDNLPNELPRDASRAFGNMFMEHVLPELNKKNSTMISNATIAENGFLTKKYEYLKDFVEERVIQNI